MTQQQRIDIMSDYLSHITLKQSAFLRKVTEKEAQAVIDKCSSVPKRKRNSDG